MVKRLMLLVVLVVPLFFIGAGEYQSIGGQKDISFSVNDTADTALSVKFRPSTGLDSFLYHDSIMFPADTSLYDTVSWVSPSQKMQITLALDGVVPDTSITYSCSLDLGTNITGFEYDPSGLDDTTAALLIDNLIDSFNNVVTIKDTILAEDSVSYIKIISKIAQIGLEGDARWTMKVSDSLDTVSTWVTSVADVCSALVVGINALDSARFWTATDEDTVYIVTGNKNNGGIHIFAVYTDTAQDTVYLADSVSSNSFDSGTVSLGEIRGYKSIKGILTLNPALTGDAGVGNSDSAIVALYTSGVGTRQLIAVDTVDSLPVDFFVALHSNVGDTMLQGKLEVWYYISDTCTDTNISVTYPLHHNLILR